MRRCGRAPGAPSGIGGRGAGAPSPAEPGAGGRGGGAIPGAGGRGGGDPGAGAVPGAGGRGGIGRLDTGGRGASPSGDGAAGAADAPAGAATVDGAAGARADGTSADDGVGGAATGAAAAGAGATGAGAAATGAAATAADAAATGAGAATSTTGTRSASAFLAPAFFFGSGSSGCWSRTSPSRSALRRTRSACGSTMLDEWLFTPMPSAWHRSSASLLVSPSSRANSYTRIFAGKSCPQPSSCLAGRSGLCSAVVADLGTQRASGGADTQVRTLVYPRTVVADRTKSLTAAGVSAFADTSRWRLGIPSPGCQHRFPCCGERRYGLRCHLGS